MNNWLFTPWSVVLAMTFFSQPLHAQVATGYAGSFSSAQGIGVYGYSSGDRSAPNQLAPGVYGESNQGVGVYGRGDISNSNSSDNEGGYFEGGKGIYARGTDSAGQSGYGARIYSTSYRGMYAQGAGGYFDAYFGGTSGISANGFIDRLAASLALVVNLGAVRIEPGDLVAMAGIAPSPEGGQAMLGVAKLDAMNQNAIIGVAKQAMTMTTSLADGSEAVDFEVTTGSVEPNNYLVIITGGLAPAVNTSSMALLANGMIGDKIALAEPINGNVTLVLSKEIGRSSYQVPATVVGKMAGAIDEINGSVPLYIDID